MRYRAALIVIIVLVSCHSGVLPHAVPTVQRDCAPGAAAITVVAASFAFDHSCIGATSDTPLAIHFENDDFGVLHDIDILPRPFGYNTPPTPLFFGEIVTGRRAIDYRVGRLPAGLLIFLCYVHHDEMQGYVAVSPVVRSVGDGIDVSWGSAPREFVFDVQVKRPGSTAFTDWKKAVTTTGARYTPAGAGEYSFRVALYRKRFGVYGYSPGATALLG